MQTEAFGKLRNAWTFIGHCYSHTADLLNNGYE